MRKEHKKLYNVYLVYESLRGHKQTGYLTFKRNLLKFFEYLEEMNLDVSDIKVSNAHLYQKWLIEKGRKDVGKYSASSISNFLKSVKSFYRFLKKEGIIYANAFLEVRGIREDKKIPRNLLKEKELNLLLTELTRYHEKENILDQMQFYKTHVIAELMYATGLRSAEVAKLKPEDIDFDRGIVNVREGKGGIERVCFLNEYAKRVLEMYVKEMRELIFNEYNRKNGSLFGIHWKSLNDRINKELKKATEKLGFKTFTSHCFRHCVGYHLLKSGCDIRYIQEILGHRRITSTEIYTKVDKEDLKAIFDKYHPRKFNQRESQENIA